MRAIL
jgi:hypothetical protein